MDSRATGCPRFEPRWHLLFFFFFAPAVAAVVAVDAIVFVVFGVVGVQNGVPRRLLKT